MNFELKELPAKLEPVFALTKKYVSFIFIILVMIVFGFLVFRINQLNSLEPDDDAIAEKLKTVQRPKVDPTVLTRIEQLRDQNVQVQSLFENARENPFSE